MLGLTSTNDLTSHMSLTARRKIFHLYPNGGIPLAGLLSLLPNDSTDKAEFDWYTKPMPTQQFKTVNLGGGGTSGPFSDTGTDTAKADSFDITENLIIRVRTETNGTDKLRVNHTVWLKGVVSDAAVPMDIRGVVTTIPASNKFEIRVTAAYTGVSNDAAAYATPITVIVTGSAWAEGTRSGSGSWTAPDLNTNYTQIFKTPYSSTGTGIKPGMIWDETGHFSEKSHDALLQHMTGLEFALMFGQKQKYTTTNEDGDSVPVRTMGGIYHFLEAWDTAAAATTDADPNKRIIRNTDGTLTYKEYTDYMARLFKVTNQKNFEKVCFCGSGHVTAVNEIIEDKVTINTNMLGDDKFRFKVKSVETLSGTVHYVTHPLFNGNAAFNYSGLYLDLVNLDLRPLNDRDTMLQENIQLPDADYIKNQYITEIGLENIHAESHMWIDYLTGKA